MFRALANKRRGLQDSMVEEWDRKVVRAFNEHHPVVRCRQPRADGPAAPGDAKHDAR